MFPTMNTGHQVQPPPMSRKDARAAGLKTFTSISACRLCGSRQRTVHTSRCCGCAEVEKRRRQAQAKKVRDQVLASARTRVLRELDREARAAAQAAEKEAKAKERQAAKLEAEKQRKAQARAAARTARRASAAIEPPATVTADSLPWDDSPSETDSEAPWD